MKFIKFAQLLQSLEKTKSRNDMTSLLAEFLDGITEQEFVVVYLIQGRLKPKFVDLEFNLSQKLILKALENLGDSNMLFKDLGDCGLVAEKLCSDASDDLEIVEVYEKLIEIANLKGAGSQDSKIEMYLELIKNVKPLSAKYITRVIVGNLRLGLSDKTILDSISWLKKGDKSLRSILDRAYGIRSDIGEITKITLFNKDFENILNSISLKPLTPVASKLVERAKDTKEVWERMPNCFVQPKLDGLRGQIHYDGNENVEIFSRNMERLTLQFPEIVEEIKQNFNNSFILDSEIIGWDEENKTFLPFQETIKRKRKYDIQNHLKSIPIKAMCFDVLYFDGTDLTQKPLNERINILFKNFGSKSRFLEILETKQIASLDELTTYFEEKVYSGLEGIITKQFDSFYEPGTRNFSWIKLKANTVSSLVDTIDVVVLGYYYGKGARAKFGVGTLLAGVYDPDKNEYYSLGKVGSGFTDEDLKKIKFDLCQIQISEKPDNFIVDKNIYPDVWVEPKIIMEIVADEITRSNVHTAGKGFRTKVKNDDFQKGLSIRFPRMKIWNRQDKDIPTTVTELVRMYELRKG
ncbi:MAG: putative DNA ligase [Candidatus Dojkabacteria bacterium]|nr:MAG: putative DNA ligase [Candidatus Dojkabacteria bacterium]